MTWRLNKVELASKKNNNNEETMVYDVFYTIDHSATDAILVRDSGILA